MNARIIRLFIRHSVPMLLALALLGGSAVGITTRFLRNEQQKAAIQKLTQIQVYYEIVLEEMDSLNIMFSTNPSIVNRLKSILEAESWTFQETQDIRSIRNYITAPANARPHIDSIYIYQENSRRRVLSSRAGVLSLDEMNDTNWYDSYFQQDPSVEIWADSREIWPTRVRKGKEEVITIYRSIYNGLGRRTGVMVLNLLKRKLIENNTGQLSLNGETFTISDDQGMVLLQLGTPPGEGGQFVHFSLRSQRFGWLFDMAVSEKELNRLSKRLSILTGGIALVAVFLGFFLTYQTNRKEREFILRTLELLEQARGEKMPTSTEGRAENLFDFMTENILQTFINQDYLKMRKEAMEYRALQMQINPHFLFNTLETINWRAVRLLDGPNDVSRMISLMSKILKYAMKMHTSGGVALDEEMKHSDYYLELQRIRFPGKFVVDWNIHPDLSGYHVPRLIFQPLLENSFNHGFRDDGSPLTVLIEAYRKDGRVHLCVKDNGQGMKTPLQEQVAMHEESPLQSEHVGLYNVQKRLYLFFKGDVTIHVDSGESRGTEILFVLPA